MIIHVPPGEPMRLDVFLAEALADHSRSEVQSWCKQGLVAIGDTPRKGSFTVHGGEAVRVAIPQSKPLSPLVPEDLPLDIVHEDDSIIVVNKSSGDGGSSRCGRFFGHSCSGSCLSLSKSFKGGW